MMLSSETATRYIAYQDVVDLLDQPALFTVGLKSETSHLVLKCSMMRLAITCRLHFVALAYRLADLRQALRQHHKTPRHTSPSIISQHITLCHVPISQPVGPSVMSTSQQMMPSHCKVVQQLSMLCGQTSGGHLALPHGTMLAIHVGVALACHVLISNLCSGMDHTLEGFHDCA